jgi:putative MATE family efflux protein
MTVLQRIKKLFAPIDLTKGEIHKTILVFLIPIMLSLVFQQANFLTDSIVIGRNLSAEQIAGVNDVGPLVNMVIMIALGAASGFSVVTSHKAGAHDPVGVRKSFLVQLYLSLALSVILTVFATIFTPNLLKWLSIVPGESGSAGQAVYQAAYNYLLTIYIGIIFQVANSVILSVLRAIGDSYTPFLFMLLGVVVNIVLDILFVAGFHWGELGAAWATNITCLISGGLCFLYAFRHYPQLRFRKGDGKVTFSFVLEHLKLGLPLGFQFSILEIGAIIMQRAIISFDYVSAGSYAMVAGTPAQVGYSIACKYSGIFCGVYSSLGTAMMSFMGQNYGAKNWKRIKDGFKASLQIGTIFWVLCCATGFLLMINNAYLHIFLDSSLVTEEVIKYGNTYMLFALPTGIFLMVLFDLRNTLQGLSQPLFPFLAGVGELFARSLLCIFLPSAMNGGPIDHTANLKSYIGVCLADPLAWISASLIMVIPFIVIMKRTLRNQEEKKKEEL